MEDIVIPKGSGTCLKDINKVAAEVCVFMSDVPFVGTHIPLFLNVSMPLPD